MSSPLLIKSVFPKKTRILCCIFSNGSSRRFKYNLNKLLMPVFDTTLIENNIQEIKRYENDIDIISSFDDDDGPIAKIFKKYNIKIVNLEDSILIKKIFNLFQYCIQNNYDYFMLDFGDQYLSQGSIGHLIHSMKNNDYKSIKYINVFKDSENDNKKTNNGDPHINFGCMFGAVMCFHKSYIQYCINKYTKDLDNRTVNTGKHIYYGKDLLPHENITFTHYTDEQSFLYVNNINYIEEYIALIVNTHPHDKNTLMTIKNSLHIKEPLTFPQIITKEFFIKTLESFLKK